MHTERSKEHTKGLVYAASSYLIWGILPVYWKWVDHVQSDEVLAHRILWAFVFTAGIVLLTGQWADLRKELSTIIAYRKKRFGIILASLLISGNWFLYIWAVNHDRVVEASLGYYINPLVSVLLGVVVLKESLSLWQFVSFGLATTGVLILTIHFGSVPWIALTLAVSFGLYGLLKKLVPLGALNGLTIETLIVTPFVLLFLGYLQWQGTSYFGLQDIGTTALLMGGGVVTAIPLLLFASGAKRIPLYMMGFLQYIAPSISLMLGVFLYHEPFTGVHLLSFSLIWAALTIFSLSRTKWFTRWEQKFKAREKSLDV